MAAVKRETSSEYLLEDCEYDDVEHAASDAADDSSVDDDDGDGDGDDRSGVAHQWPQSFRYDENSISQYYKLFVVEI